MSIKKVFEIIIVIIFFFALVFVIPKLIENEKQSTLSIGYKITVGLKNQQSIRPSGINFQYYSESGFYLTNTVLCSFYDELPYGYPFYVKYALVDNKVSEVIFDSFPTILNPNNEVVIEVKGIVLEIKEGEFGKIKYYAAKAIFEYYGSEYNAFKFSHSPLEIKKGDSCKIIFEKGNVHIANIIDWQYNSSSAPFPTSLILLEKPSDFFNIFAL